MTKLSKSSAILPPGSYVIGDPCYMVPDDEWDGVLTRSDFFEGQCHSSFQAETAHDGLVIAFSTKYGDGAYRGSDGNTYGVDAGLIGIAPAECFDGVPSGCHLVEFHQPVECHAEDGVIVFGHVEINTAGDDIEDDYSDDYDIRW